MLVTLKEILKIAQDRQCAVGAFNATNLTTLRAVIHAAEELNEPVIIMHAQVHEEMGVSWLDEVAPIMLLFAKRSSVPVCVHLDHGTDIKYIEHALELGFTGVMYDGSNLSNELNTENSKKVVELAKKYGASVEAEIGSMGGSGIDAYTDPKSAEKFVADTGIDALACAFGTVHGFYAKAPKLDFDRLAEIHSLVDVPLVMHGGSGVSKDDYKKVIARGIRKINYYTYMAKAGAEAVNGKSFSQFHELIKEAENAMKLNVQEAISVFSGRV